MHRLPRGRICTVVRVTARSWNAAALPRTHTHTIRSTVLLYCRYGTVPLVCCQVGFSVSQAWRTGRLPARWKSAVCSTCCTLAALVVTAWVQEGATLAQAPSSQQQLWAPRGKGVGGHRLLGARRQQMAAGDRRPRNCHDMRSSAASTVTRPRRG